MKIPFYLVTPEKIVFQQDVESATMPTVDGEITVLPHHIPLITALTHGVIQLKTAEETHYVSVSHGVVKVDSMGITVLSASAERADEMVMEQVEKALADAKKLAELKKESDEEYTQAMAIVAKESARLHALRKHHTRIQDMTGKSSS